MCCCTKWISKHEDGSKRRNETAENRKRRNGEGVFALEGTVRNNPSLSEEEEIDGMRVKKRRKRESERDR